MTVNDVENLEQPPRQVEAAATTSRSKSLILGVSCCSCILVVGIICLVLYLTGFFTFEEPSMEILSFTVGGLEMGQGDSSNLLGSLLPTQATLQLNLVLEVNNTNPFDIDYNPLEQGNIHIPEFLLNGESDNDDGPVRSGGDFFIGNWAIPDGTLSKRSSHDIPVEVFATIDLAQPETLGLAPIFLQGGKMAFLIDGGIEGNTWVPFVRGEVRFLCLVQVDNILAFGEDARIRCLTSVQVGRLVNIEGEINARRHLQSILEQDLFQN